MSRDVETLNMGAQTRLTFDQQLDQRLAFAAWEELFQQVSARHKIRQPTHQPRCSSFCFCSDVRLAGAQAACTGNVTG